MNRIPKSEQIGVITLFLFLFFFDFISKFIGYEFFSALSPFSDFIDAAIAVAIGDVLFFGLLFTLFSKDVKPYFSRPDLKRALHYGLSLKILFLGIMVPVGIVTININHEFFYDYWDYKDIPLFAFSRQLFSPVFRLENIAYFVCVAIVTPIIEEVFYRLILYRVCRRRFSPFVSVIFVATLFSLMHPRYFFFFFIFSFVLSFLIHKTGSVWSAIVAHCIFNSLVYVDTYYLGVGDFKPFSLINTFDVWLVQSIFLPISLLIIYFFFRKNRYNLRELYVHPLVIRSESSKK